jgi:hypothetical protein
VELRFAGEPPRRGRNRELGGAGDGKRNFGYCSSIRVVQREDARGTVALDRAAVVGVHESTDEGGGEESEEGAKSEKGNGGPSKRSPMRRGTHQC